MPPCLDLIVADDNHDSADSLSVLLSMLGHTVRTGYDGLQAVALFLERPCPVVILDLGMPGLDGFGAARAIRAACADTLLIAVSGYDTPAHRQAGRDAGFQHHFRKPLQFEDLRSVLARAAAAAPAPVPGSAPAQMLAC